MFLCSEKLFGFIHSFFHESLKSSYGILIHNRKSNSMQLSESWQILSCHVHVSCIPRTGETCSLFGITTVIHSSDLKSPKPLSPVTIKILPWREIYKFNSHSKAEGMMEEDLDWNILPAMAECRGSRVKMGTTTRTYCKREVECLSMVLKYWTAEQLPHSYPLDIHSILYVLYMTEIMK